MQIDNTVASRSPRRTPQRQEVANVPLSEYLVFTDRRFAAVEFEVVRVHASIASDSRVYVR